jgi:hypothetical protein
VRISAEGLKIFPFAATCIINLGPINSWYHSRFRRGQIHRSLQHDISHTQQPTLDVCKSVKYLYIHCKHSSVNPLKTEFLLNNMIYINPVRTSQETHYVSATKPNRLMLFRETVAVYRENLTEHTDIYINSVRTSQETHYLSATELNRLMLFRETIAVYCDNHTEHTTM